MPSYLDTGHRSIMRPMDLSTAAYRYNTSMMDYYACKSKFRFWKHIIKYRWILTTSSLVVTLTPNNYLKSRTLRFALIITNFLFFFSINGNFLFSCTFINGTFNKPKLVWWQSSFFVHFFVQYASIIILSHFRNFFFNKQLMIN